MSRDVADVVRQSWLLGHSQLCRITALRSRTMESPRLLLYWSVRLTFPSTCTPVTDLTFPNIVNMRLWAYFLYLSLAPLSQENISPLFHTPDIPGPNLKTYAESMSSYEQFTQYDIELEVPEEAVQNLDENVRKGRAFQS